MRTRPEPSATQKVLADNQTAAMIFQGLFSESKMASSPVDSYLLLIQKNRGWGLLKKDATRKIKRRLKGVANNCAGAS